MSSIERPFRIIEPFLDGFLRVEALVAAFQLGVIDALVGAHVAGDSLAGSLRADATHLRPLIGMLVQHEVLQRNDEGLSLSEPFRATLEYRDLLEARLDFAHRARGSITESFVESLRQPGKLAAFDKLEALPEDAEMARTRLAHAAAYSRYCAPLLFARHDFSRYRRLLAIGGSNCELAIQLCRRHPGVRVTFLGLPAVCESAAERTRGEAWSQQISFVKGDARVASFEDGFDAVLFSSMLHDSTAETIARLLANAQAALLPGGTLLIFEPYALDYRHEDFAERHVERIPSWSSCGAPERYVEGLARAGWQDINSDQIDIIHHLLTTARRGQSVDDRLQERLRTLVQVAQGRNVQANAEELWFDMDSLAGVQIRLSGQNRDGWYDRSSNFAICYSGRLTSADAVAAFEAIVAEIKRVDDSILGFDAAAFREAAAAVAYPTAVPEARCGSDAHRASPDADEPDGAPQFGEAGSQPGERRESSDPMDTVPPPAAIESQPAAVAEGAPATPPPSADRIQQAHAIFLNFCAQVRGDPGDALLSMHWGYWADEPSVAEVAANLEGPYRAYSEKLLAQIPAGVSRVLDVGCGLGYNAKLLSERNIRVTALSPVAHHCSVIENAKLPGVDVRCARFEQLVPGEPYDLLLFSESINHFRLDAEFLEHCQRFLKRTGFILLADELSAESVQALETQSRFRILRTLDITKNVAPNFAWWAAQLPLLAAYRNALLSTCELYAADLAARVQAAIAAVENNELKFLLSGETQAPPWKGRYLIYLLQLD